jgi:enediyne biosynthesis protein E4
VTTGRRWEGTLALVLCAGWLLSAGSAPMPTPTPTARAAGAWPVRFVDIAPQVGLTQPTIYGGVDRKRFIIETNGCGVAMIDVDNDGWVDLLTLNGTRLAAETRQNATFPPGQEPTPHLYHNDHGRFRDVTERSGLRKVGWASSVCAGDYDNDGFVDLFVTYFGRNVLYHNRGDGTFEDVTARAGLAATRDRWGSGCSFVDYDRDGKLDLFIANYVAFDLATAPGPGQGPNCTWKGVPVNCGPRGLPTDTNLLYHNNGDGTFTDVSEKSGIAAVTGRYSMTAAAADFDGDGWVDIYVATDSTAAILYHNNHDGTFTDVALESGSAFSEQGAAQAGMGVAVGDYNLDGLLDLVKTHFADDIPALYRNLGKGRFEDVAAQAGLGVQNRFIQWGVGMPDLDNDGRPDIFYVTGNVYPEVEALLPQYPHRSPRIVFRNEGDGRFTEVTALSGPGATTAQSSRGAAFGDFDNDGDIDVLIMNMNAPPSLLRNDYAGPNGWLEVALEGVRSNRMGLGATVLVTVNGRTQARAVLSQSSYYSHDDRRLHFGLGTAAFADRVEVRWPSGQIDEFTHVRGRQLFHVQEGGKIINGQASPN